MAYEIEPTPRAEKWIKKADPELRRRFLKKIERLREYPKVFGKPLRGPLSGTWELKLESSFRILFSIDEARGVVVIEAVLHKDEF